MNMQMNSTSSSLSLQPGRQPEGLNHQECAAATGGAETGTAGKRAACHNEAIVPVYNGVRKNRPRVEAQAVPRVAPAGPVPEVTRKTSQSCKYAVGLTRPPHGDPRPAGVWRSWGRALTGDALSARGTLCQREVATVATALEALWGALWRHSGGTPWGTLRGTHSASETRPRRLQALRASRPLHKSTITVSTRRCQPPAGARTSQHARSKDSAQNESLLELHHISENPRQERTLAAIRGALCVHAVVVSLHAEGSIASARTLR